MSGAQNPDLSTPLPVLMEQAMAMKESQLKEDRRRFDSWPSWYRNSLYSDDEILEYRKPSVSFDEKLSFVDQCKDKAKIYFKESYFDNAIFEYEKALGIFNWIEHRSYNSKIGGGIKGGIKDEDLMERAYSTSDESYL